MGGNYTGGMITVYGEGRVDLVPMVEVADGVDARVAPLQPALGGGPFNVAIASARQGAPVQFVSRLSSDGFGSADRFVSPQKELDTGIGMLSLALESGGFTFSGAVVAGVFIAFDPCSSIVRY